MKPRPESRPNISGIQPEITVPVELVGIDNLPVQLPGHPGEQHTCLAVSHVLADAAAGAGAEGAEALAHVLVEGRVVVWVGGREPALGAELAGLVPVALAVEHGEDGGLDSALLVGLVRYFGGGLGRWREGMGGRWRV